MTPSQSSTLEHRGSGRVVTWPEKCCHTATMQWTACMLSIFDLALQLLYIPVVTVEEVNV